MKIASKATKPNPSPSKDPQSVAAKVCLIASNIRYIMLHMHTKF